MSDHHTQDAADKILDLLAEQSGGGLSDAQQAELDAKAAEEEKAEEAAEAAERGSSDA